MIQRILYPSYREDDNPDELLCADVPLSAPILVELRRHIPFPPPRFESDTSVSPSESKAIRGTLPRIPTSLSGRRSQLASGS
mmetsp:Transcript_24663/g.44636  ORF Transcript_24663/g.44636 Transcript_24663/m.44636 type:complete len:82 (-) Transcript_24663:2255-2500(-)